MPRSKRSKVVISLTNVSKKTKEHKNAMMTEVQANAEKWRYCWLFEVGSMRNSHLKTVRKLWKDSARIFFGRGAVMAKALGTTVEEEHRLGLSKIATQIKGQVGLFFTDSEPQEVIEWFADFQQPDFARAGNRATRTVILPIGPEAWADHNYDRGVPTLTSPHKVCEKGKTLTSEQAQLLKLIGLKMVTFRVGLMARWDSATGEVTQIEGGGISADEKAENEDEAANEAEMSE
ncbi:ribosomal protein L10-domain-containing protein [Pholiota molesta]|nr:ribosomal protein L10-domain-containing protein [Pholiota molesta]